MIPADPFAAEALWLLAAGESDAAALDRDGVRERLGEMLEAAFSQGARGLVADIAGYCLQPWGFEPEQVEAKTLLLYGSRDPLAGPRHGRWWQKRLPNARLEVAPGAGHLLVVPAWPRILAHLAPGRKGLRLVDGSGRRRATPRWRSSPPPDASAAQALVLVEELEQLVRGELDLLVPPLRGAVLGGDQTGAMQAAKVAEDERVAGLRLVARAFGEPEMPLAVLVPRVALEERVLVGRARLDVTPVALQHVLATLDETAGARDTCTIDGVRGDARTLPRSVPSYPRTDARTSERCPCARQTTVSAPP